MDHPNILFLFADQHHAGVLGAENHPDVRTPHLDRLAASGTRFTRAYCQDAVCVASRNSLFSGLYPRTLGCRGNSDRSQEMNEVVSLQRFFQQAGYRTAAFGKRHLHRACDAGWDIREGHLENDPENYAKWIDRRGLNAEMDRDWAAEWGRGLEGTPRQAQEMPYALFSVLESQLPEDATMEAWTRQRTISFLEEQRGADQPFLCYSAFYRPHQPYTPLPRYYARFDRSHWGAGRLKNDGLAMPPSLRQPLEELPPLLQGQCLGNNRIFRLDLARADEQHFRDYIAAYYALVEEIDEHVGAILDTLEECGQLENTIIIYSADHGDFVGAHGMCEKCASGHNVYEETLRVPLMISWPGRVRAGEVSADLAELVDLYPTLRDLAGLPEVERRHLLQGQGLAAHLTEGTPIDREYTVTENWSQSAVITPRHKLGIWTEPPAGTHYKDFRDFGDMLFDRETDPHEVHNLTGHPDYAEVEADLRAKFQDWLKRVPTAAPGEVVKPGA